MIPRRIEPNQSPGGLVFVTSLRGEEVERFPATLEDRIENVAERHGDDYNAGRIDTVTVYDGDTGEKVGILRVV